MNKHKISNVKNEKKKKKKIKITVKKTRIKKCQ